MTAVEPSAQNRAIENSSYREHELFSMVTLEPSIYKEVVAEIMKWNELLTNIAIRLLIILA